MQNQANQNAMEAMLRMPHLLAGSAASQNTALLRNHPAVSTMSSAAQYIMGENILTFLLRILFVKQLRTVTLKMTNL